jgi:hypothetical protein
MRANQSLHLFVNAVRLMEKQQISMLLSFVRPDLGLNSISTALNAHYTTDMVIMYQKVNILSESNEIVFTFGMSQLRQELSFLPENQRVLLVRVARSLVFFVVFCRSLFVLCHFTFGHCVVCPSISGFWLPIWYLKALLPLSLRFFLSTQPRLVCMLNL